MAILPSALVQFEQRRRWQVGLFTVGSLVALAFLLQERSSVLTSNIPAAASFAAIANPPAVPTTPIALAARVVGGSPRNGGIGGVGGTTLPDAVPGVGGQSAALIPPAGGTVPPPVGTGQTDSGTPSGTPSGPVGGGTIPGAGGNDGTNFLTVGAPGPGSGGIPGIGAPTGGTNPPGGGETTPPGGGTTTPPGGGDTTPPGGGTTNPPGGGDTNPPGGGDTTPPGGGGETGGGNPVPGGVPEPATWVLMAIGFAMTAAAMRGRLVRSIS